MNHRNRLLTALVTAAFLLVFLVTVWALTDEAESADLTIPIGEVITGPPGSVVEVAELEVGTLAGSTCLVHVDGSNNESEHPDTDLLVDSDGAHAEFANVEAVAGGATTGTATILLGETVTVSVRLGPDGVSSGGLAVGFNCTPTTTVPSTTTSTSVPSTTTLPDAPPPPTVVTVPDYTG